MLEEDQDRGGRNTSVTSIVVKVLFAMVTVDAVTGKSDNVVGGAILKVTPPQQGKEQ